MIGIIYKMTILTTGKYYVGQHIGEDISNYWGSGRIWLKHIKFIKNRFPKCWKKLVKKEILYKGECNQRTLDKLEEVYIRREKSLHFLNLGGCNILPGTVNNFGSGSPSKISYVRKKISKVNRGRPCKEENKKKFSKMYSGSGNPFYGKHHTKETLEKIQRNRKPFIWSKEIRDKVSKTLRKKYKNGEIVNAMYGKHHTEETKKKLSLIFSGENNPMYGKHFVKEQHPRYGKHWDEEHRKHQSEVIKEKYRKGEMESPMKGKHLSEEARKKISQRMKERMKRPEDNPFYGKHHTDETKRKISESKRKKKVTK